MNDHYPQPNKMPGRSVKIWVTILSILLTLCLVPSIMGFPLKRTVFNSNFYINILNQQQFFERMPGLIASTMIAPAIDENGNNTNLFSGLNQTQAELLVNTIIPAGWLEEQALSLINLGLDFINLESNDISIKVDLQPLKNNLSTDTGRQMIMMVISGFPACSGDQLNLILIGIQTGQSGLVLCNPPVSDLPVLDFVLTPISNAVSSVIPSSFEFPTNRQSEKIRAFTLSPDYVLYRVIRKSLDIMPWVSFCLTLIIISVSFRSKGLFLLGLGLPLIFAGILSALMAGWFSLMSGQLASFIIDSFTNSGLSYFGELIQAVGQQVIVTTGSSVLIWSLGALMIGLVLIAVRLFFKK